MLKPKGQIVDFGSFILLLNFKLRLSTLILPLMGFKLIFYNKIKTNIYRLGVKQNNEVLQSCLFQEFMLIHFSFILMDLNLKNVHSYQSATVGSS